MSNVALWLTVIVAASVPALVTSDEANHHLRKPVVFVVTYFRAGSSFLGDLLQHAANTFYFFEPLRYITLGNHRLIAPCNWPCNCAL